jgi:hypothetical protein
VSVAALPVKNPWGEVVAVAQVVKRDCLFNHDDLQVTRPIHTRVLD